MVEPAEWATPLVPEQFEFLLGLLGSAPVGAPVTCRCGRLLGVVRFHRLVRRLVIAVQRQIVHEVLVVLFVAGIAGHAAPPEVATSMPITLRRSIHWVRASSSTIGRVNT